MNLKEFLNYRNVCPVCDSTGLSTFFGNLSRQKIRLENDSFVVFFDLYAIKKHNKQYKLSYSIDIVNNTFLIDFYHKDGTLIENDCNIYLLDRYKEYCKNIGFFTVTRACLICDSYNYSSNLFKPDLKNRTIGDLKISKEYWGLHQSCDDGYKIFKLTNFYNNKTSLLIYAKSIKSLAPTREPVMLFSYMPSNSLPGVIETNIIQFTNRENTIERINRLLLFT